MKHTLRLLCIYSGSLVLLTALFIGLFRTPILGGVNILFYRGLGLLSLSCVLTFLICLASRRYLQSHNTQFQLSLETIIASVMLGASLNLSFFIVIPVTIDRSVSTFLLSRLSIANQTRGPLSKAEIEQSFVQEFVGQFDAVGRRLEEQKASGNVKEENDKFEVTDRANAFLNFSSVVADVFGIEPRYVTQDAQAKQ